MIVFANINTVSMILKYLKSTVSMILVNMQQRINETQAQVDAAIQQVEYLRDQIAR